MSAILTVTEAAEKLRRSERFVLDELRRKNLRGSKYGGAWSIAEDDLDAYREAHANVSRVRRAS
jgi:excisionase family DNA binding protein